MLSLHFTEISVSVIGQVMLLLEDRVEYFQQKYIVYARGAIFPSSQHRAFIDWLLLRL